MEKFTVVSKFAKNISFRNIEENTMDNKFDLDLALIPKELKLLLAINRSWNADEQLNKEDFNRY